MKSHTAIVLSTLQGVQDFMNSNAAALGTLNTSDSRKALDDLEAELSHHAAAQTGGVSNGKAAIARQKVLKSALIVKYLKPISAIAQAQLSQAPDFVALKLPRGIRTTQQWLAAAKAMGDAAAQHTDTFVGAGMDVTFIADLRAAADDVKNGAAATSSTRKAKVGSTNALKVLTQQAHKVVTQLDALIQPRLATNTALLTQWNGTKRFTGSASGVDQATTSSAGTTTVPQPADAVSTGGTAAAQPAAPSTATGGASAAPAA